MSHFSAAMPLLLEPGVLDPATCGRIRRAMDRGADDAAEIVEDGIALREEVRRARSVEIEDELLALVEARIEAMRAPIEAALRRRIGEREGTGFLRYRAGGFYLPHRDRGGVAGWPAAARRSVAVVLFLNDRRDSPGAGEFAGGTLRLYPGAGGAPVEVGPRTGLLAAFPADVLHEVLPVREGTRDAAVDWFYDWAGASGTSIEPDRM